jgi:sugar lactone lactonase YvrE
LSNRRIWAQLAGGAVPDGICLDAEGAIWVASPSTDEALRVREGGEVTGRVKADRGVYACMLGGADRRTLYLLTAKSTDPDDCRKLASGRIEAVEVAVPGAGLP